MSYISDYKHGAITKEEYDQFAAEENYADKVDREELYGEVHDRCGTEDEEE